MSCTCLIPFFNERERILKVLDRVVKIKAIDEILCVDDGSTDGTAELVKKHYPNVKVISNPKNLGKTEAVKIGLQQAKGNYILLLDADLRNLNSSEIKNAVVNIKRDNTIDMIVLRRLNAPFFIRLVRGDILVSGERILGTVDLQNVLEDLEPKGYQLEFAINKWMIVNNKKVYWMPSSALNTYPTTKIGFIEGLKKSISMNTNILRYLGLKDYFKQVLFFCRKRLV